MASEQDRALQKEMTTEAEALAKLLSTPDRCVMVFVIVAHSDEDKTIDHVHALAGNPTTRHAHQFWRAIKSKLLWLEESVSL